ncbi:MAG: family 20 glycosylhydrolase [Oscillospiraceae bacterium]|nr:family 20 glycosylhydrolase [Oscillospiraceae bacterium]
MKKPLKRILSVLLTVLMLGSVLAVSAAAESKKGKMNIVLLDAGRKYFSVAQIEQILDRMAADGYTDLELATENNGCRFLLDDMSVKANGKSYSSDEVKNAIIAGTKKYYDDPNGTYLTQKEMDELYTHAQSKGLNIIPLMESPGHMNALVYAMETLGVKSGSATPNATGNISMNIDDAAQSNFVRALLGKYMNYYKDHGSEWFNMGCDEVSGYMPKDGKYNYYIDYVNMLSRQVKRHGLKPIMFNDILYYDGNGEGQFDKDIAVAYWNVPAGSVQPAASVATIEKNGHKIFNHNCLFYYVVGVNESLENINYNPFSYKLAKTSMRHLHYTDMSDGTKDENILGACVSIWCDTPKYNYDSAKVLDLIDTFAQNNPEYFS